MGGMSDHPLRELHAAAGARFAGGDGDFPLDYGDPAAEYRAVRTSLGLLDRSAAGVLEVTGRDRASFLHAMLTNDVKSLAPGGGCAASLLDVHGKIQVFVWILVLDERIIALTPPGLAAKTVEDLDRHLFSEKAYLRDATGELALLVLAGPDAPVAVERLSGVGVPERAWSHVGATLAGAAVRLVRGGGETGEAEVWITCARGEAAGVWESLRASGARPAGRLAFESLRIETGTPAFGLDADQTVLLPEIPFADQVSYSKGCYLGQEVVVRIRDRGHVNRMLRGLVLEGDVVPDRGARVLAGNVEVGSVTSATWSFGLGRPIALGIVRRQHAEPGTRVAVAVGAEPLVPATVSALPFPR